MSDKPEMEVRGEAGVLARQMFEQWQKHAKDQEALTPEQARERARDRSSEACEKRVTGRPSRDVSWRDFLQFLESDPERAMEWWRGLKVQARAEWENGLAAAELQPDTTPWERARFLQLRTTLVQGWEPGNAIESTLLEMMCQSLALYFYWVQRLATQSSQQGRQEDEQLKQKGYWVPPRVGISEAIEQSSAMCDRFERIFLRGLRALVDMRRRSLPVHIEHAGQVNLAERQVNLAEVRTYRDD
jgi:hypothetical protein